MFRFVLPLCAAMFVTLLIAGRDNGQMRPGLARAVATGEEIVLVERSFSPSVVITAPLGPETPGPDRTPVSGPASGLPPPVELRDAPAIASVPREEPTRTEISPKPVFTLSALSSGNGQAAQESASDQEAPVVALTSLYADPSDGGAIPAGHPNDTDIRTVSARSVNVRLGPSVEAPVVARLSEGEAVRVLSMADPGWVEVVIEGDGLTGYVAARFLSPGM